MLLPRLTVCLAALAALIAVPTAASAQDEGTGSEKGTLGLGLIIGEPTGVSARLYLGEDSNTAIQGAAGSAVLGGGLQVHGDYVIHPWILENRESFVMPAYIGGGLRFLRHESGDGGDSDFHTGVRLVLGMLFDFKDVPLDVFVEIAGVADIRFDTDDEDHKGFGLDINAGAGARYYF
jgi:hypothetical protein